MGDLKRDLTLLDATMINVGCIIGSGIFFVPKTIAGHMDATLPYFAVWIAGGVISLFGALAMAELGASLPRTGGLYVYLKEAYGPVWGYLYGWTSLSVINTASIAALAVAFATYLGVFVPLGPKLIKLVAILSIILLTFLNCLGVKLGARVQNTFSFLKVGALLVLVLACFFLSGGTVQRFQPLFHSDNTHFWGPFGMAMIAALWAYDGWIEVTYIAGEVKNPQRNLPKAILLSTVIIIVVYLLVNLAFVYSLGLGRIGQSERVAADSAGVVMGAWGTGFIALAVMVSTFGANNGFILGAARIYYAMAREGLFFPKFAETHPTVKTPVFSLIVQAVWACILVLISFFDQLITWVVFASWIFYILCIAAVFILRRKRPHLQRPYRTWGHPFTSIMFIIFAVALVLDAIIEDPGSSLFGIFCILAGLPLYARFRSVWKQEK